MTMVICAVLKMFFPGERTAKILTLVLSLFALISLTSPMIDIVKGISAGSGEVIISETEKDSEEIFDSQVKKEAGDYLSEYVYNLVCESGHAPVKVSVNINSDEDNGIFVDKLSICFDSKEKLSEDYLRNMIVASVGVEPQIEYIEMTDNE